jgi:hypothetical protein
LAVRSTGGIAWALQKKIEVRKREARFKLLTIMSIYAKLSTNTLK